MRRNNFESIRDDHITMQEVLDEIEARSHQAAAVAVDDAFSREQDMNAGFGYTGGFMGQGSPAPMQGAGGIPRHCHKSILISLTEQTRFQNGLNANTGGLSPV